MRWIQDRVFMTLLGLGAAGFFLGLFLSVKAAGNHEIQSVRCADAYAGQVTQDWLELTDCELNLPSAVMLKNRGDVEAVYIPLYPSAPSDDPPAFVLKSKDAELIRIVVELDVVRRQGDPEAWYRAIEADLDRNVPIRTVDGLAISAHSENNRNALALIDGISDSPTVIAEGRAPQPLFGGLALLAGLALWGGAAFRVRGGA